MNREKLTKEIINHEGFLRHAYTDTEGFLTIGIGRLIDKRKNGGISYEEARYLLENDIDKIDKELPKKLPWITKQPDQVQRALYNMAFQMGIKGLLTFRKMLKALEENDYATAHKEALDSKWARQTPHRAQRIAAMLSMNTIV